MKFETKLVESDAPKELCDIAEELGNNGYEAYLVGGCVRDLLLGREPKDWDVSTNAKPEEIQKIFPESVYKNEFGTVGVKTGSQDKRLKIVEVTTFRLESKYTDKRHPDKIRFAKTIKEDLARRDFTINSMAMDMSEKPYKIIDLFGGRNDLKSGIIRTVGNPEERFTEDALRLMRAARFAAELDFKIEQGTEEAIKKYASLLEMISKERIRDEFVKIIMSDGASRGILILEELGLLRYVAPEIRKGINVSQNKHHIYTVFEHNVRSLDYAAKKKYPLYIRLAALLHDVGKPDTKRGEGPDSTFYNHEIVGAKIAARIMDRLRFPKEITEKVYHLVRYHLFYYNVGEVTEAGVRRFLARVGPENVDDLIKLREADRIGSGVPKAVPYKIRHLLYMIEKVKNDPISPKMLKVNGEDVMEIAKIKPSPRVGWILGILLKDVLDDPKRNTKEYLTDRICELNKLGDEELADLSEEAKSKKEEFESGLDKEIRKKFMV